LETVKIIEKYNDNSIYSLAFTADSAYLLFSKDDYVVHVMDIRERKLVNAIETSYNRKIIASISSNKVVFSGRYLEAWDIDTEELLFKLEHYEAFKIIKANKTIDNVSWINKDPDIASFVAEPAAACFSTKDDNKIYYAGANDPVLSVLNLKTGKTKVVIDDGVLQAKELKVSQGDKYIAVSSRLPQGDFVWDLGTGKRVATSLISDKYNSGSVLDFHPDIPMLAFGSHAGFLTIVDLIKEEVYYSEKIHDASINQIQFIEKGIKVITAADDGRVIITELPS
jgi:WD40 repeat protein